MADGAGAEVDLSQLTATQQEALQQYTDVTSQEISEAIAVLQRSQWNVQVRQDTIITAKVRSNTCSPRSLSPSFLMARGKIPLLRPYPPRMVHSRALAHVSIHFSATAHWA
jgi:hypothetical protein